VTLSSAVEGDAAEGMAGHPGPPEGGQAKGRTGRRRRRPGQGGRGTMEQESPPGLGLRERGGHGVLQRLAHVQHQPSEPWRKDPRDPGPLVYPAEDSLYARWPSGGDDPKPGNQGRGACAREDEGDGVCAGPVQTLAGCWARRRRWRRPPRGLAPEHLPVSLACCACVPNVRQRGQALLPALMELLVT